MKEWIIEADESTLFYMFKHYEPLTRCKDCESHGKRTNMCDIWHRHTSADGFCHRAKSKEQKAKAVKKWEQEYEG